MKFESQIISSLLALIGTLMVVTVGYIQWRKQNGNPNRAGVSETKRKAVEAIWLQLEDTNLALRTLHPSSAEEVKKVKLRLNKSFLNNSFYLDDDLQFMLNEYVDAMIRLADMLIVRGTKKEKEMWGTTMMMTYREDDSELDNAMRVVSELRGVTRDRLMTYVA